MSSGNGSSGKRVSPLLSRPVLSRRSLLGAGLGGAAWALAGGLEHLVDAAAASCPAGSSLGDIEHVVILIQENRSFDTYFGTYRGVRGFDERPGGGLGPFSQRWPGHPPGHLLPFRFNTADTSSDAECTNDITHEWGPQHQSWNKGRMDSFVAVHEAQDGAPYGTATMGYWTRQDLPFHHALADAFTICDRYHCSVFGPTYPNRLYSMTGTIDPEGRAGGPVITNPSAQIGIYSWETYPERLQAAGVSWKVYSQLSTNNNVLPYFKAYSDPASPLVQNGMVPVWPTEFEADVATGRLPQVSWVLAPMDFDEHPPAPPTFGAWVISRTLSALVGNPDVWARTALFVTYDENGGYFDHVPPPTAPAGTAGEYVTVRPLPDVADGVAGPIGLGFRVPFLVVSPFSRGGLVCSDTFDHTSLLRYLETRFRVPVPNLSTWRRRTTGDLTTAFNLAARPDTSVPALPAAPPGDMRTIQECGPSSGQATVSETVGGANVPAYAPPGAQRMPTQEPGRARRPRPAPVCAPSHR
ncbi:MAG TPA: alkaline phosphatase family protein [Acidimicrobiales bacterium]|nr:alkaline phosphatase family protein [Acidimicrobiales bacterium]